MYMYIYIYTYTHTFIYIRVRIYEQVTKVSIVVEYRVPYMYVCMYVYV